MDMRNWGTLQFTENSESKLPKYRQIAEALSRWIERDRIPSGTRLPGDRQLAKKLGVTPVTVGRALNELVKRGLLTRQSGSGTYVMETAPSQAHRIGIIYRLEPSGNDPYFTAVLMALQNCWLQQGIQTVTLTGTPENYEKLIADYRLSGAVILTPLPEHLGFIASLRASGFPVVTIGYATSDQEGLCFGTDHKKAAVQCVRYLKQCGHRRIGLICGSETSSSTRLRRQGYAAGMWQEKLPVNPDWELYFLEAGFESAFLKLICGKNAPTALIVTSSRCILPVYNLCAVHHIRIPDALSIMGFDDFDYFSMLAPPLTVLRQQIPEFCRAAARHLLALIRHETPEDLSSVWDCDLIERGSVQKKIKTGDLP